jgi:hypothetical protein
MRRYPKKGKMQLEIRKYSEPLVRSAEFTLPRGTELRYFEQVVLKNAKR